MKSGLVKSKFQQELEILISILAGVAVLILAILIAAVSYKNSQNIDASNNEEFIELLKNPEVKLYVDKQNYWNGQAITQAELSDIKEYQKDLEFKKSIETKLETQQKLNQ